MPAYSHKLHIFPAENGAPGWIMDFPIWWDTRSLFANFEQRRYDTGNPLSVDYALLLSVGEAIVYNREALERFARDSRSQQPFFQDQIQRLNTRLSAAKWVVIESFEWESGLE